jgi:hypothetical protein
VEPQSVWWMIATSKYGPSGALLSTR